MKLAVIWDVDPEIFHFFGISVKYYSVLFVTGLLLSIYVLTWMFKVERIPKRNLELLTVYGVIGIVAGARLAHCLIYDPGHFLSHPLEIFLPIENTGDGYKFSGFRGLASHGGALGLIIAIWLYTKKTKDSVIRTLDLVGVVAPLAGVFIRLANLMNSEIIGTPTTVPWAFVFKQVDGTPRHPAQLYEAIAYLLIFLFLLFLYKSRREKLQHGVFFGLSLILIFLSRFFIEFVKSTQVAAEDNLRFDYGQLLSIPFVLCGIGFVIYGLQKSKHGKLPENTDQPL
jgi:phosphatidylglycerol---prolipoprotein diacylglyceryl transferase